MFTLLGLIVASLIAVFISDDFFASIGLSSGIVSMLIMIAIGAPMYICSTSSIPIAIMLIDKGLSPGAAFVFLFMGPFTNAASLIMISKKFSKKTTIIYFVSAAISAIGFGLLLDYIVNTFDISLAYIKQHLHEMTATPFQIGVAVIFLTLIAFFLVRKLIDFIKKIKAQKLVAKEVAKTYSVEGMTCGNCAAGLEAALRRDDKVTNAEVNLEEKLVKIWGEIDATEVKKIVEAQGYSLA